VNTESVRELQILVSTQKPEITPRRFHHRRCHLEGWRLPPSSRVAGLWRAGKA